MANKNQEKWVLICQRHFPCSVFPDLAVLKMTKHPYLVKCFFDYFTSDIFISYAY